jgi:hypothetical protein
LRTKFRYAPKVQVFAPPKLPGTNGLDWTLSIVAGGAAGGAGDVNGSVPGALHRNGRLLYGTLELGSTAELLIYTGDMGENSNSRSVPCSAGPCYVALGGVTPGGYGGGGAGGSAAGGGYSGAGGGGATVVAWDRTGDLGRRDRHPLLVAAGGGGDGGSPGPTRTDWAIGHGGSAGEAGTDGRTFGDRVLGGRGGGPEMSTGGGSTGGRGGAGEFAGGTTDGVDAAGNPCTPMTCIYYSPELGDPAKYVYAERSSAFAGGNGGPGFAYLAGLRAEGGGGGGGGGGLRTGGGGGGGGGVFWSGCSYPCPAGTTEKIASGAGAGGGGGSSVIVNTVRDARSRAAQGSSRGFVDIQSVTFVFVPRLSLASSSFAPATGGGSIARACARGTRVRYHDARAAQTSFTVLRRSGGHVVKIGSFTRRDRTGENDFQFTGRVAGHALRPGSYELQATPRYRGALGTAVTAAFRIVAGC